MNDDQQTIGPAPQTGVWGSDRWHTMAGNEWSYWDLWFCAVCVADHDGDWDQLDAAVQQTRRTINEGLWCHLVNLTRRPVSADLVAEAIDLLTEQGPALGRPLVDRIQASRFHHMKELRPDSSRTTEVRLLFAFDPQREAIFLVAGDKSEQWKKWYQTVIPIADVRFEEHLTSLKEERQ